MIGYNTYIQQLSFDGLTYKGGSVVDLLKSFNIVCQEFPFEKNPKPKSLSTRDWAGTDGADIYIPESLPLPIDSYDIEVVFIYTGTELTIRRDLNNFIDFLYGRIKGDDEDTVKTGRLAIYNEYVGMGRKDIVVKEVANELFYLTDSDSETMAKLKVKFTVYDPTTEVIPTYESFDGTQRCKALIFAQE